MTHTFTSEDIYLEKLNKSIQELYIEIKTKCKKDFNGNKINYKEEIEKIKETKSLNLIDFIKDSIDIYINLKIKEKGEENEKIKIKNNEINHEALDCEDENGKEDGKENGNGNRNETKENEDKYNEKAIEAYETLIKKLEADKRNHIKVKNN
jgi:hypothetical protein